MTLSAVGAHHVGAQMFVVAVDLGEVTRLEGGRDVLEEVENLRGALVAQVLRCYVPRKSSLAAPPYLM
jgi:hypothetical protein